MFSKSSLKEIALLPLYLLYVTSYGVSIAVVGVAMICAAAIEAAVRKLENRGENNG
jgi:hypothetical protein